jgi:hypothetical protein
MATPIWQDTIVEHETISSSVDYSISVDESVIYHGKLTKRPGEESIKVNVNNLVKDYLTSKIDFDPSKTRYEHPAFMREFSIEVENEDTRVVIYNDWSYEADRAEDTSPRFLSSPLSTIVDPRQYVFITASPFGVGGVIHISGLDASNRVTFSVGEKTAMCTTFVQKLNALSTPTLRISGAVSSADSERPDSFSYTVKKSCADYCLYYLNAYGGYDHLLINGTTIRTDSFARTEITKSVLNTTHQHGKQSVSIDITPKWRLNTDYLTDEQWAKTHHLLGSPYVLLHNLVTDEVIPVVITSNTAEFKTYRNQGRRKSFLTIEVEASVKRMRK